MAETLEIPKWFFELAFGVYVATICFAFVLEQRRPAATFAWIMTLIFVPVIGVTAYFLIGRHPHRRYRRRVRHRMPQTRRLTPPSRTAEDFPLEISGSLRGLVRLAQRLGAGHVRCGLRARLLSAGDEAWNAIHDAVMTAEQSIYLEFYIWRDDAAGEALLDLLVRRARDGVRVRILYDFVGSLGTPASHFAPLESAGGQAVAFAPVHIPAILANRTQFRNHRKLISVDGKLGFLGGINVGNEYLRPATSVQTRWEDLLLGIEGGAAASLEKIFAEDWADATDEVLELSAFPFDEPSSTHPCGPLVQLIPSSPDIRIASAIGTQFCAAISAAQQRCWLATPYLIPDEALLLCLTTAAMRGVDLRILVPKRSDQRLATVASHSFFDELLEAGCQLYEYPRMLHSKYLLIDDTLAAIGSANMDMRSFHLNYEITAFLYDEACNAKLARLFEHEQLQAREVRLIERRRIGLMRQTAEALMRMVSPLI